MDEAVLLFMKGPHSYTGEDLVEISCHGSPPVLGRVLGLCLEGGARLAEPGEFTRRAFLNGKMDLSQAEAVVDLIQAQSRQSAVAALAQIRGGLSARVEELSDRLSELIALVELGLDFPEEDAPVFPPAELRARTDQLLDDVERLAASYRSGRIVREGLAVAIIGKPNVGKSSLFNALLRQERAIVTPLPGTTRDFLEEPLQIDGLWVRLSDTAGLGCAADAAEEEGVARARGRAEEADATLAVFDGASPWTAGDEETLRLAGKRVGLCLCNKCDLLPGETASVLEERVPVGLLSVSVIRGEGLDQVVEALRGLLAGVAPAEAEGALVTRERHWRALREAVEALRAAGDSMARGLSGEFCAVDLYEARRQVDGILGRTASEDVLDRIFREFCLGK